MKCVMLSFLIATPLVTLGEQDVGRAQGEPTARELPAKHVRLTIHKLLDPGGSFVQEMSFETREPAEVGPADHHQQTSWPDLSDPKAAAFSLCVALATGDEKTAKEIYIGKDKEFFAILNSFVSMRKSYERFNKAAFAHFGKNAAGLAGSDLIELKFAGTSLTTILATTRVELVDRSATLTPTMEGFKDVKYSLKKVGDKWKVTDFPLNPLLVPFADLGASVFNNLADEIERGQVWQGV